MMYCNCISFAENIELYVAENNLFFVGITNFKCGSRSRNAIADTNRGSSLNRVCYFLSMYLEGSKLMMNFFIFQQIWANSFNAYGQLGPMKYPSQGGRGI